MSETWTEYAVRWDGAIHGLARWEGLRSLETAQAGAEWVRRKTEHTPVIVGRTVTASDWLPVDTDGAK